MHRAGRIAGGLGALKEFLEQFPEFETVIVDATEQERAQPKAAKKQENGKKVVGRPKKVRKFFSGKTKMHALKTQIAVTPDGLIVHQSATVAGPMADSMLLRRARLSDHAREVRLMVKNGEFTGRNSSDLGLE